MADNFLHGMEVIDVDSGPRPITTVRSSVIGICGTAPNADPAKFPLNIPVLIAGSRREAAALDTTGAGEGTLPAAMDSIFDQCGAVVIVVRVEEGLDDEETLANILGGVDPDTGAYEGVHAFLAAKNIVGYAPRLLAVPGFTHTRVDGGVTTITVTAPGSGYAAAPNVTITGDGIGATAHAVLGTGTNADKVASIVIDTAGSGFAVEPVVTIASGGTGAAGTATLGIDADADKVVAITVTAPGSGYAVAPAVTITGNGTGATAHAVLGTGATAGKVIEVIVDNPGSGYTSAPAVTLAATGSGATATASFGTVGNPVVAELIGIAERLRAIIIPDGPNTNDADAIAYASDFGSKRVYLVDPKVIKTDEAGTIVSEWSSPCVAGLIARIDNERGFWWSPSNQLINGIQGTHRPIDFTMGDPNSRANLLNEKNVSTIIRDNGYYLWGNRTLSSDPKWAFLCIVRTADIINDSILANHKWAVDRGMTSQYVKDVVEGVNAFLRHLKSIGAILGGTCWADPDLNTPDQIAQGHIYFDFDFTGVYPAERITMRSHLVNDYIQEIF